MSLGNNLCAKFPPNKIQIVYTTQGAIMANEVSRTWKDIREKTKGNSIGKMYALNVLKCETKLDFFCRHFSASIWNCKWMAENAGLWCKCFQISIDRNLLIQWNHNVVHELNSNRQCAGQEAILLNGGWIHLTSESWKVFKVFNLT